MSRLECIVGGVAFTTTVEILTADPESFFSKALDKTWNSSNTSTLVINRDGTHFQHVLSYLIYGYLPRDPAGRCNIPKEVLELLSVEADFYGLPALSKEINQLLKFNIKGMKYFISTFFENSSHGGSVELQEFGTYEEALAKYERYKLANMKSCLKTRGNKRRKLSYNYESEEQQKKDSDGDESESESESEYEVEGNRRVYKSEYDNGQNIVVDENSDPVTGKIVNQVFEDGNWKRPMGLELVCIPVSGEVDQEGAMYTCNLRSHCDNRDYYW